MNYFEELNKDYRYKEGLVISAMKTSELEGLAQATAPLLATLPEFPSTSGIQQYLVYNSASVWKPEYFDMGSAIGQWFSAEQYATWLQALDRAVPHRYASNRWLSIFTDYFNPVIIDPEHVVSMSMYIPVEGHKWNDYYGQTSWWKEIEKLKIED